MNDLWLSVTFCELKGINKKLKWIFPIWKCMITKCKKKWRKCKCSCRNAFLRKMYFVKVVCICELPQNPCCENFFEDKPPYQPTLMLRVNIMVVLRMDSIGLSHDRVGEEVLFILPTGLHICFYIGIIRFMGHFHGKVFLKHSKEIIAVKLFSGVKTLKINPVNILSSHPLPPLYISSITAESSAAMVSVSQ